MWNGTAYDWHWNDSVSSVKPLGNGLTFHEHKDCEGASIMIENDDGCDHDIKNCDFNDMASSVSLSRSYKFFFDFTNT
jgi:hypothetical protein